MESFRVQIDTSPLVDPTSQEPSPFGTGEAVERNGYNGYMTRTPYNTKPARPAALHYTLTNARNLIRRHQTSRVHRPGSRNPATESLSPKPKALTKSLEPKSLEALPKLPYALNPKP